MKLYIAGGASEHGRNSFLVEGKSVRILVDCGLMREPDGSSKPFLTDEQINEVYTLMGAARGNVTELIMTNEIERSYLEGFIPDEQLGTRSISSVLVTITEGENNVNAPTSTGARKACILPPWPPPE